MKIIIIGGGPGGYVAAIRGAMLGADVTVIEKSQLGGTCLNTGCIPTKTLLNSTNILDKLKKAKSFGIKIPEGVEVELDTIMEKKDKTVAQLVKGIEFIFRRKNVKIVRGFARLISRNEVEVINIDEKKQIIKADKIILATGSLPIVPPLFPYDGKKIITSEEALCLREIPKSMIIVGGGIIGCEFGQFFNSLGSKITIIEKEKQLLPFEDEDVARQLERSFKRRKIGIKTGHEIRRIDVEEEELVAYCNQDLTIKAEKMLISVGRKANLTNLGLEDIGIKTNKGRVVVNEKMETNIEGIYAIGDIVESPLLAHVASREGIVAMENALGKNNQMSYKAVPRCLYTSPEIASVGLTEKEAKRRDLSYRIGKFDFRGLGKAQAIGEYWGFTKILADDQDKIIGATIVGASATELLAELTLAVELGLTTGEVRKAIHPHPTLSEGIMEALDDVHKESIHTI